MAIRPASCGKGVLSLEFQQHNLGIQPFSGHNQACHDPHFVGKMLGQWEHVSPKFPRLLSTHETHNGQPEVVQGHSFPDLLQIVINSESTLMHPGPQNRSPAASTHLQNHTY